MLEYISDLMDDLNIPYEFGEWTDFPVPDPYFVGEFNEIESNELEENGYQETQFILTGTGTKWIDLATIKDQLKTSLPINGVRSNGNGIAVFYGQSLAIPTGEESIKRIQINLTIKEWSVI